MPSAKKQLLLVVDDEEDIRESLAYQLRREGFDVMEAENGSKAFQLIQTHPIVGVISDIRMPDGNGVELLDNIKNVNSELPVLIFITGFSDITLAEAYHRGAEAYFEKPYNPKELIAAVKNSLIQRNEKWAPSHRPRPERVSVDFKIKLKFESFDHAIETRVITLARGGMFVLLNTPFPEVNSKIDFDIEFESGGLPRVLSGSGVVRWIRFQREGVLPTGCGVEFLQLNEECLKEVVQWIETHKPVAFIPKM